MKFFNKAEKKRAAAVRKTVKGYEPEINKWNTSEFVVRTLIPLIGYTPFPVDELLTLVNIACIQQPDFIYEWGTHVGKSARIFAETVRAYELKSKIISIDLPENVEHVEHPHKEHGRYVRGMSEVTLLRGDGVTEAIKHAKHHNGRNKKLLFFLDGDHTEETVARELYAILRSFPRASIIVHDTFNQSKQSKYNIGPYLAIKKTAFLGKKYSQFTTNFGLPGMTVLIPKSQAKK